MNSSFIYFILFDKTPPKKADAQSDAPKNSPMKCSTEGDDNAGRGGEISTEIQEKGDRWFYHDQQIYTSDGIWC